MANLQKQIDALTAYFRADCARPGVLPIALTIEHFITRLDGTPVDYAQVAQVIYSMQGHDEPSVRGLLYPPVQRPCGQ